METKKILQSDVLDIIFDERNKSYGAYELRKNYHKRARKAVGIAIVFALVAISAPLIAELTGSKAPAVIPTFTDKTIITDVHIKVDPPKTTHINPPSSPPNQIPTAIVPATDIPDDIKPPIIDPPSTAGPSGPQGPGPEDATLHPGGGASSGSGGIVETIKDPEITYSTEMDLQQWPEFPGGEDALLAYLGEHIHYPPKAVSNEAEGRVIVGFVVNKEGGIDELKVLKGIGYGCDEEAMRVIGGMPKWKPGKNNGKAVRVYYNLPIVFELNK